ncbi:hypothetical protein [Streptomyces sp. NPDC057877]|uniref:hypothetical protein n=1 Tax=Streptomyces sp. NPDC057877 TaxID=3346269 RepID=UPI0036B4BDDD
MELTDARVLVPGATAEVAGRGARVALAGRAGAGAVEIRPGHLGTGFAHRPVAGTELVRPDPDQTPVVERRAR